MKKQKDTLTGLKQGYSSHNKWNNELNKFNNSKPTKDKNIAYPNGIIPLITITVSAIIGLGLSLGLTPKNTYNDPNRYIASEWFNIIWYILGIIMCFYAFWALGRAGFFSIVRFSFLKFSRVIKFDILKKKTKIQVNNCAVDYVNTLDEWEDYIKERKKHTKKIFLVSLIVYSTLFFIWTIVMSILNAV